MSERPKEPEYMSDPDRWEDLIQSLVVKAHVVSEEQLQLRLRQFLNEAEKFEKKYPGRQIDTQYSSIKVAPSNIFADPFARYVQIRSYNVSTRTVRVSDSGQREPYAITVANT